MLTLGQAKQKILRKQSHLDPDLVADQINAACEVLITDTKLKDALLQDDLPIYGGILTLPRYYQTCLGILRSSNPLLIRDPWLQYSPAGPGSMTGATDPNVVGQIVDLGDGYCCIREPRDINAAGCLLKFYTDASPTTEIYESILQIYGLDGDGRVIRTTTGTNIRTGEAVDLLAATGSVTTTNAFTKITQVVKPNTNGVITVYAIDPGDPNPATNEHLVAAYQPSEKNPNYRRYKAPVAPDNTDTYTASCLLRLRFVEAELDNDFIFVDNFVALEDALLHLQYRGTDDERADRALNRALGRLSRQASNFRPANTRIPRILNADELNDPTLGGY